jgi:hypothetical protein
MREKGPLTEVSAFNFEGHFGDLRFVVVPGTPSIGKQIIEALYLKVLRSAQHHYCFKRGHVSMGETTKGNDEYVSVTK